MALINTGGYSSNFGSSAVEVPEVDAAFHREMDKGDLGEIEKRTYGTLGEPMDADEFSASVKAMLDDATDFIDGFIAPARAEATSYERGDPLGNEEDGRSQVVITELRDTVLAQMPSYLRVLVGSENVVEFQPTSASKVVLAQQQTDYIKHVFMQDNPGFMIMHSVLKDGLVRTLGIAKWWHSEETRITESEFTGLDQGMVNVVRRDETVEVLELEEGDIAHVPVMDPETDEPAVDPQTGAPILDQVQTYDMKIRRHIKKGAICVAAVPPEEFLISRDAKSPKDAKLVAHRQMKTISSLVAMGYDPDEIEEHAGDDGIFLMNYEATVRNPSINSFMGTQDNPDPSMREVLYCESYARIDKDGDGIAELRKICSIGTAFHILHDEITDEVPFAVFCPDPQPHMVFGGSVADQTMDTQRIKSGLMRGVLDSLAQCIHPRMAIVEGQVNIDDALNPEVGAVIRTRQIGAVQPFTLPFVGQSAMPVIDYVDAMSAKRTGTTPVSAGLDPDVLQSTTQTAVNMTLQGSQERMEMTARICAEGFMTDLFKGIYRLVVKHQDKARTIELNGSWVEVDPRTWEAELDCAPTVGLGRGTDAEQMQMLTMIAGKQEQIIMQLGPVNPICTVQQYANTLRQITQRAGFKNTNRYFKSISDDDMKKIAQASQQQKPDPQMLMVQIEGQKVQVEAMDKQAKRTLDQQTAMHKAQLDLMEFRVNSMLKLAEINAKYGTQANVAALQTQIDADIQGKQQAIDAEHGRLKIERDHQAKLHGNLLTHAAALHKNEMTADVMKEQAANEPAAE